ncbi:MAG: hypothetical protein AB7O65_04300 [Candidatus Korobacteraceae bacterium]
MAIIMCFEIFSLSACNRVGNEFVIHDPEGVISSAELDLCGKRLQLTKSEGEIRGEMHITCEGGGSISVHLSDGRETTCHIGYVTPGAEQVFEFVVEGGQCR